MFCPQCGTNNDQSNESCLNCEFDLSSRIKTGSQPVEPGPSKEFESRDQKKRKQSYSKFTVIFAFGFVAMLLLIVWGLSYREGSSEWLGMRFVWVKPGSFIMGSNNGNPDEMPPHQVNLLNGFYMQTTEVTQAQWMAVMEINPSEFKGNNLPVDNVSWHDVQQFIQKLNQKGIGNFRLPTEAEWEYSCRAGTTGDFAGDPNLMGWYKDSGYKTHPVGTKLPNAWGIYDMHGNVAEWCQDSYSKDYFESASSGDSKKTNSNSDRVTRGGSWRDYTGICRSSYRFRVPPEFRLSYNGFRLVREI